MKDFIVFLLCEIVNKPDAVQVEEQIVDTVVELKITVDPEDMGLVIGKSGKTIRSLRALAKAKAIKEGVKVYLHVND